jgi:hypothetical protein
LKAHLDTLEARRRRIDAALPSFTARLRVLESAPRREEEPLTLRRYHLALLVALTRAERSSIC